MDREAQCMEVTSAIDDLLRRFSGEVIELCYKLYELVSSIKNDECLIKIISYLCEAFGTVQTDNSVDDKPQFISYDELNELQNLKGDLVDEMLISLLKQGIQQKYSKEKFYAELWHKVIGNPIFSTKKEKVFTFYYILIDKRIPYYVIDEGLRMNDVQFGNVLIKKKDLIRKMYFVLELPYEQKTQEASLVLTDILKQDSFEEQVVLMASIMAYLRNQKRDGTR
jgi:hypothetical protein